MKKHTHKKKLFYIMKLGALNSLVFDSHKGSLNFSLENTQLVSYIYLFIYLLNL